MHDQILPLFSNLKTILCSGDRSILCHIELVACAFPTHGFLLSHTETGISDQ